jgi:translation initiation factor 3 subunit D
MQAFTIAQLEVNENGWGPTRIPDPFIGIPFASYEKKNFVGHMADWSARAEQYREQRQHRSRPKEVANDAFVAAIQDTEGFNLVDTRVAVHSSQDKGMRGRGRGGRFGGRGRGGRWAQPPPVGEEAKFNAKFGKKVVAAPASKWRKNQAANYSGGQRWSDQKSQRTRESSVDVRPDWVVMGQIDFPALINQSAEVPEFDDVHSCGAHAYYDKMYDRIVPKAERPLLACEDRAFFKVCSCLQKRQCSLLGC